MSLPASSESSRWAIIPLRRRSSTAMRFSPPARTGVQEPCQAPLERLLAGGERLVADLQGAVDVLVRVRQADVELLVGVDQESPPQALHPPAQAEGPVVGEQVRPLRWGAVLHEAHAEDGVLAQ